MLYPSSNNNLIEKNRIENAEDGIVIEGSNSNNNVVRNNTTEGVETGIRVEEASDTVVEGNSTESGIRAWACSNIEIKNNTVEGGHYPYYREAYFYYYEEYYYEEGRIGVDDSEDVFILNNVLRSGDISVYGSARGKIDSNTIDGTVRLRNGSENFDIESNVIENGYYGLILDGDNLVAKSNRVENCRKGGVRLEGGDCVLENNVIESCEIGIDLWGSNNVVRKNIVRNHLWGGIGLKSPNNKIKYNEIENNGIGLYADENVSGSKVKSNNITNNVTYGIYNRDYRNELDAESNWWGDDEGPSGACLGDGDAVSGNVDYDPWVDAPYPDGNAVNFSDLYQGWVLGSKEETVKEGPNVEFDAVQEVSTKLSFKAIISPGTVTVKELGRNPEGNPPPGVRELGKYVIIETTVPAFPGGLYGYHEGEGILWPLKVNIYYSDNELSQAGIENEKMLRMYYWDEDSNVWYLCSETGVDAAANLVSAKVYHLSTFALMTLPSAVTPEEATELKSQLESLRLEVENLKELENETRVQEERIKELEEILNEFVWASSELTVSIQAGDSKVFNLGETPVTKLTLEAKEEAGVSGGLRIYALKKLTPAVPKAAPGNVFDYLYVSCENMSSEDLKGAEIRFKVDEDRISNKIDEDAIKLYRFDPSSGEWEGLPTEKVSESGGNLYYSAESPGLSYFAISGRGPEGLPWLLIVGIVTACVGGGIGAITFLGRRKRPALEEVAKRDPEAVREAGVKTEEETPETIEKQMNFVRSFLDSDREAAKVSGDEPAYEIFSSLAEAVNRLGEEDRVEVLKKKENVYLRKK